MHILKATKQKRVKRGTSPDPPDTMDNYVSLEMDLDSNQLDKVNTFIDKNDRWTLYNNCSSFSSRLWNSVSDIKLNSGKLWNTPTALANSIMEQDGYSTGRNFAQTNKYYYNKDKKLYSVDISNKSINGDSSSVTRSVSSGYGAYLNVGCSYDTSSGYSSNVSNLIGNSSR